MLFEYLNKAFGNMSEGGDVGCKISRPTLCRVPTSEPSIDSVRCDIKPFSDQVPASWRSRPGGG